MPRDIRVAAHTRQPLVPKLKVDGFGPRPHTRGRLTTPTTAREAQEYEAREVRLFTSFYSVRLFLKESHAAFQMGSDGLIWIFGARWGGWPRSPKTHLLAFASEEYDDARCEPSSLTRLTHSLHSAH